MKKTWFALLVLAVIAIGLLHTFTPGHNHLYHDTYRRIGYFPITIGAILFGIRGGLLFASLTSIAFIPHLLIYFGRFPDSYVSELTEVVLYLLAGIVVGVIAEKEKRLRDSYRRLSEKLERSYARLHEETTLLIDAEEQLRASQKAAAVGTLAASLVHEIKNPLASIRGAAEIVLDDYPEGAEKRKFPEIILAETGRLNTTVNEVLNFAREPEVTSGNVVFKPLAEVLEHLNLLLESGLEKKGIHLIMMADEASSRFLVDGDRMLQVLMNLILNSEDALSRNGEIRLNAEFSNNKLIVTFKDSGPGIAPDIRDTIFTPFVSGKEDGTGLGLSISRKIVESYRGTLELMETDSSGAGFRIVLPEVNQDPDYYETV